MKYCPLMSFGKEYSSEQGCFGKACGLAGGENGECLIHRFLVQMTETKDDSISEFKPSTGTGDFCPWDY